MYIYIYYTCYIYVYTIDALLIPLLSWSEPPTEPGELESPAATLLVPKELEPSATVTWHMAPRDR